MVNTFIKFWTKTPIMFRSANYILVWFGAIVGIILGTSVTLALILSSRIENANYLPFFNQYFILFPIIYVLGTLIFFQDFWFKIGKIIKRLLAKEKYEWHRPRAVFFGGFLGGALYVILLSYLNNISVWYAADFLVLFLPFSRGLARLGCLNLGCCVGINLGKYILIGIWSAVVIGITFSLHFRKAGQSI